MPRGTRSFLRNTFAARRENAARRRRHADGLKGRRLINETLENRQLLAGPDLVGIQPNEGELLVDGTVLNVSPRELTFRFTDDTVINPNSLDGIRITRAGDDGVFEAARATSDLGTGSAAVLEFRSLQAGVRGDNLRVIFTNQSRIASSVPLVSVETDEDGNDVVRVSLNSAAGRQTRVGDLVAAVANDPVAGRLVEVIPVTGAAGVTLGGVVPDETQVTLIGANAAEAVTDFGTGGDVRVRFVSNLPGADGRGTRLDVSGQNFNGPAAPVVFATGNQITIRLNTSPGFETTAGELIDRINADPDASALVTAVLQEGSADTPIAGGGTRSVTLAGANDIAVSAGFVGLGDTPNEVIFRFAEPLPDDIYQIDILGDGPTALLGAGGMAFGDGENFTRRFAIDLGPRVAAVVPTPVRRSADGTPQFPVANQIDVYFEGGLDVASAEDRDAYQLIFTGDTVDNADDVAFVPSSVDYSLATGVATLTFTSALTRLAETAGLNSQTARLRIGSAIASPANPSVPFSIAQSPTRFDADALDDAGLRGDAGDNGGEALNLNGRFDLGTGEVVQWNVSSTAPSSVVVGGEIRNERPFDLDLPGPDYPGVRQTRVDDPTRNDGVVALDYVRRGADARDGITEFRYDFRSTFLGDDPNRPGVDNDRTYFNSITEIQRQRVREALSVFSQYLGVNFVEVESLGTAAQSAVSDFTIAVGDLAGANPDARSGDGGLAIALGQRSSGAAGSFDEADLVVLDLQDFDESNDDQFGDEFFRGALFGVGQFLGFGYADDLPQPVTQSTLSVFEPEVDDSGDGFGDGVDFDGDPATADVVRTDDAERLFLSPIDIINGQYLYRPDSTDIDLYRFELPAGGTVRIETIAERLASASTLDTTLRLFRQSGTDLIQIAGNDDYFSDDSFLELDVAPGRYVVGVSAAGNDTYNPLVPGTGFGGRSEGDYDLRIDYVPRAAATITDRAVAVDLDGDGESEILPTTPLDGDADGRPGGTYNFWFRPSDNNNTLFVDKAGRASTTGQIGGFDNPYRDIDSALAAASPGQTVRVLGNGGADGRLETLGDNLAYTIGFAADGSPLDDGADLTVPRGVSLVVDSSAILKMSRSQILVGSDDLITDRSGGSIQLLGTPTITGAGGLPVRGVDGQRVAGSVYVTSLFDGSVGAGGPTGRAPSPGDWGGVNLRGDIDGDDATRAFDERDGAFLNQIQFADLRYGGGVVVAGGRQQTVAPIELDRVRATITGSRISDSGDAAIAATPDTFAFDRFTTPVDQGDAAFTLDYQRIGPAITGNTIVDNVINGLSVRVATRGGLIGVPAGTDVEQVNVTARFDDTDVVHVLTENVTVAGTPGGPVEIGTVPATLLATASVADNLITPQVPVGTYVYTLTFVDDAGNESLPGEEFGRVTLDSVAGVRLRSLPPVVGPGDSGSLGGFSGRRLYRAPADAASGAPAGAFRLVGELNAGDTSFVDNAADGTRTLPVNDPDVVAVRRSRLDGSFIVDPGATFKSAGARIEARFDANVIAEGTPGRPVVFTSLADDRYGTGGTFDTAGSVSVGLEPGQWGGIYLAQGASGHIADAVLAGGGGRTRIEGGFASFGILEAHQAELRLADSRVEVNAGGVDDPNLTGPELSERGGRGTKTEGAVFVRGAQPIIVGNQFVDNDATPISLDVNSFTPGEVFDTGRATLGSDRMTLVGNAGPLIEDNRMQGNDVNALEVRGGVVAAGAVLDDVGIVHVVRDVIEVPNEYVYGGLQLQSDARGSLVLKFQNDEGFTTQTGGRGPARTEGLAGIVAGGRLLSGDEDFADIADRIGGSVQVIGVPDFPVVLTSLADDSVGAGFDLAGLPLLDTDNNGFGFDETDGPLVGTLPTGPEVNNGTTIDNDVDPSIPGFFEVTVGNGNGFAASGVTVEDADTGEVLVDRDFIFEFNTYVQFGTTTLNLDAATITQAAELIGDDLVESRGTFDGPNGTVSFIATARLNDGFSTALTTVELDGGGTALGEIRVISYLDEDVEGVSDDILVTDGTPGENDFRAFTLDGPRRVGFSHAGVFEVDDDQLAGATYEGWAADQFAELRTQIEGGTQTYSVEGEIDLNDLPAGNDPDFGQSFGPADVTTAFAWLTDGDATAATVTSFLELLAIDPVVRPPSFNRAAAGDWTGVTIREAANDRNVAAVAEVEASRVASGRSNQDVATAQFVGELAPDESSSDENRRLGFVVDGAIVERGDYDVYSFVAEAGTEVYLDVDRTSASFDSVVELLDINGRVLAGNNDSIAAGRGEVGVIGPDPTTGVAPSAYPSLYVRGGVGGLDPSDVSSLAGDSAEPPVQRFVFPASLFGPSVGATTNVTVGVEGFGGGTIVRQVAPALRDDPAATLRTLINAAAEESEVVLGDGEYTIDTFESSADGTLRVDIRFTAERFETSDPPEVILAVTGAVPERSVVPANSQLQDNYSTNRLDAGFRVRLPGQPGVRGLYHVRVRSAGATPTVGDGGLTSGELADVSPAGVAPAVGLSTGGYQLQIRLRQADERPGTMIRQGDVRFAEDGLRIIGAPLHSELFGEVAESPTDNDTIDVAQPLTYYAIGNDAANIPGAGGDDRFDNANVLRSDRLAKSFAGRLDNPDDVDFFEFTVEYDYLNRYGIDQLFSTVIDLDYASGFGRPDMAFYVFDAAGELILIGDDSNIAADRPTGTGVTSSRDALSAGSLGTSDPYIGAQELVRGTYFIAVTRADNVPPQLSQFFDVDADNPLLRVEPVLSTQRIVEDRIFDDELARDLYAQSLVQAEDGPGGLDAAQSYVLFDPETFAVPLSLNELTMFVHNSGSVDVINPFTGQILRSFDAIDQPGVDPFDDLRLAELAFTDDGQLRGYTQQFGDDAPSDASFSYVQIDRTDGSVETVIDAGGGGLLTEGGELADDGTVTIVTDDVGLDINAVEIANISGRAGDTGFLAADRGALFDAGDLAAGAAEGFDRNLIYAFNPDTGQLVGLNRDGDFLVGAGTNPAAIGRINTVDPTAGATGVLSVSLLTEVNAGGTRGPAIRPGDTFTVVGPTEATGNAPTVPFRFTFFRQEDTARVAVSTLSVNPGDYDDGDRFSLTIDGQIRTFEFDLLNNNANPGADVTIEIDADTSPVGVASAIARALETEGVEVDLAGTRVFFDPQDASDLVLIDDDLPLQFDPADDLDDDTLNLVPIDVADDSAAVAEAVAAAIEGTAALDDVAVSVIGDLVSLSGGSFTAVRSDRGALGVGASPSDGTVTGLAELGNALFAITDTGQLFRIARNELFFADGSPLPPAPRELGTPVTTAVELAGLPFTELTTLPESFEFPAALQAEAPEGVLVGFAGGRLYAFNTEGRLLPIFAGGQTSIAVPGGVLGADFSTLATNQWQIVDPVGNPPADPTLAPQTEIGRGVSATFNGVRDAFNGGQYLGFGDPNDDETFDFPGGARGAIESNDFDLSAYSAGDRPYLYFNYYMDTDASLDSDTLRVFLIDGNGTAQLLSTSNGPPTGVDFDEFDDLIDDDVDVDVQALLAEAATWRQARVSLEDFAGQSDLRLRIEFSTEGGIVGAGSLRAVDASRLSDGDTFVVGGQTFSIDFATALSVPSGDQIVAAVAAGREVSFNVDDGLVLNGVTYVFGPVAATDPRISLSDDVVADLTGLSRSEVATFIADRLSADFAVRSVGGESPVVEFADPAVTLDADPSGLFVVVGDAPLGGTSVRIDRDADDAAVAEAVERVLVTQFGLEQIVDVDDRAAGSNAIRLGGLAAGETGPFGNDGVRAAGQFQSDFVAGFADNDFEGVFLDDFIIGFAERGEIAFNSRALATGETFVDDGRLAFPEPDQPNDSPLTGTYTVEIRDAAEYAAVRQLTTVDPDARFRVFDTNARLSESALAFTVPNAGDVVDGDAFTLSANGRTVRFEFDDDGSVGGGAVPITFGDGVDGEVLATRIVTAINRVDVGGLIGAGGFFSSGGTSGTRIEITGDVVLTDLDDVLVDPQRAPARGDDNRVRDGGVLVVEQSRFLSNENYGVELDRDGESTIAGATTSSVVRYPRNLVELNFDNLQPGVVLQSNVMAFNGDGGLLIDGFETDPVDAADPNALDRIRVQPAAVDRIVNNTIIGGLVEPAPTSPGGDFGGVTFAGGAISFADRVVSFEPGTPAADAEFADPDSVLGPPDAEAAEGGGGALSLGTRGSVTLAFEDNLLVASGDAAPDLIVFEVGQTESVNVAVSVDGVTFVNVGIVGGLNDTVDLDAAGFGPRDRFAFVQLTDLAQGTSTTGAVGADIDAVGALSTVSVESFTAGGTGINIVGNATPTIVNNILANNDVGIVRESEPALVDLDNDTDRRPALGANTFYRNDETVRGALTLEQSTQILDATASLFVRPSDLVFTPVAGAPVVDASIDSIPQRASLTAARGAVGLDTSPLIAPEFDVNGQLRSGDDPLFPGGGFGFDSLKDRGAAERGDDTGPRITLLSPQAEGSGLGAGGVAVASAPNFFELQLLDGIAPADITPGTGVDDGSVFADSVLLFRDGTPLVNGVDYRVGYNPTDNVLRLTPVAGVFEPDSTYVVRILDGNDSIIRVDPGILVDGGGFQLRSIDGTTTAFEFETGPVVTVGPGDDAGDDFDGRTLTIFDGTGSRTFEIDNNGITNATAVQVSLSPANNTPASVAAALAEAINAAGLGVTARPLADGLDQTEGRVQIVASDPNVRVTGDDGLAVAGDVGVSPGFGLRIPSLDGMVDDDVVAGDTFSIRRGGTDPVTFELTVGGAVDDGNVPILLTPGGDVDALADRIVAAVGGSGLGLQPFNAGGGRVALGGNRTYSLDLTGSVLTQIASPGIAGSIPVVIDLSVADGDNVAVVESTILAAGIPGVSIQRVGDRLVLDGITEAFGDGAVALVDIVDRVGNPLQSIGTNGRTELSIFVGGGFDYGDLPAPYTSSRDDGGPRHRVVDGFSLGGDVTAEADALILGGDSDDGVTLSNFSTGFNADITIDISLPDAPADDPIGTFYLDAFFDWNADGDFDDAGEQFRYGSADTGRVPLAEGINTVGNVRVPGDAAIGTTAARFRLSQDPDLGPTGDADSGEVEDYIINVTPNRFQNGPTTGGRFDVNLTGFVTPLDALQILNALRRNRGRLENGSLDLTAANLNNLPPRPDVNGDGDLSPVDALAVLQELRRLNGQGEGEATFVATEASGVLASTSTAILDELDHASTDRVTDAAPPEIEPVVAPASKVSVFDDAAQVALDDVIDHLAGDCPAEPASAAGTASLADLAIKAWI